MKRSHDGRGKLQMDCALKFLASESFSSAIIGKGGQVAAQIRESTGIKLKLTDRGEYYPGTKLRVITLQGDHEDDLNKAMRQIIVKLKECMDAGDVACGADESLELQMLAPKLAAGGVIGKGGANITAIREDSGARVKVHSSHSHVVTAGDVQEQVVSLNGSDRGVEIASAAVNKQVQLTNQESWFAAWASDSATGGSHGRSGRDYGGDSSRNRDYGGESSRSGRYSRDDSRERGRHDSREDKDYRRSSRDSGHQGGKDGQSLIIDVVKGLPSSVIQDPRGFALSCVVPNALVGGLIGKGGHGTKDVQSKTQTKITIRDIPDDLEMRTLNIQGPLANACAAYMLMMERYIASEAELESKDNGEPPRSRQRR